MLPVFVFYLFIYLLTSSSPHWCAYFIYLFVYCSSFHFCSVGRSGGASRGKGYLEWHCIGCRSRRILHSLISSYDAVACCGSNLKKAGRREDRNAKVVSWGWRCWLGRRRVKPMKKKYVGSFVGRDFRVCRAGSEGKFSLPAYCLSYSTKSFSLSIPHFSLLHFPALRGSIMWLIYT